MKILIVHNSYILKSGEETAVNNEVVALKNLGHQVITYFISNDNLIGSFAKIKAVFTNIFSVFHFAKIGKVIARERPDIVHVHNTFPQISPSVFFACRKHKTPVIHTLHNYRILCPSTTLFYSGSSYYKSLNGNYLRVILDGVYRESKLATLGVTISILFHRLIGTWLKIDRLIVMSKFQEEIINKHIGNNTSVIPHFSTHSGLQTSANNSEGEEYCFFAGRLDNEKGIVQLLDIWPNDRKLIIAGDGPLVKEVKFRVDGCNNIHLLGRIPRTEAMNYMKNAKAVVFPSIVHESFGLVIVESFSVGTPVLVNRFEPFHHLISDGITGFKFDLNSRKSLQTAINNLDDCSPTVRNNCLAEYNNYYSEGAGGRRLESLMREVIRVPD